MKRHSKVIDGKCYSWFEDGSGMQIEEVRNTTEYKKEETEIFVLPFWVLIFGGSMLMVFAAGQVVFSWFTSYEYSDFLPEWCLGLICFGLADIIKLLTDKNSTDGTGNV